MAVHTIDNDIHAVAVKDAENFEIPNNLAIPLTEKNMYSYHHEENKENTVLPQASLGILRYKGKEKVNEMNLVMPSHITGSPVLSTTTIMKIAKEQLLHYTSQNYDAYSIIFSPLIADLGPSPQVTEKAEFTLLLLVSAEMLTNQQFGRAKKLLNLCINFSFPTSNPVQRVVYYFAEPLRKRINKGTEIPILRANVDALNPDGMEEVLMDPRIDVIETEQMLPFRKVTQFTGIQTILDCIKLLKRIHLIDLGIKTGSQWTILMQALVGNGECLLELLKITAVGTSLIRMQEIGKRLTSFADTLDLPFSFKTVVSDLQNIKKDLFESKVGEVVAIYADSRLWTLLAWPNHFRSLIQVIKSLDPCVMVVTEIEANTNTPIFIDRFNEALFYYSAIFDSLETCIGWNHQHRAVAQGVYIGKIIENIFTSEGEVMVHRHEKLESWTALFERFGIAETELSHSSLYQAKLLADKSTCHGFCSLEMDGKSLIIKWKGTPIKSLSAWRFPHV
ncbi:GRAS family protein RAM1-like [Lycium barbarum]|uniref:GRAS family protein RAM1-like n=1 Tax=Lycium barbarum TaxID=112863 RepID=UPI00293F22C9|nr:GRAS family protein RAM1-like [Lycium barbarum]